TLYAGNIRKKPLEKIWYESKKLKWLRSLKFKDVWKKCIKCKYLQYCNLKLCPIEALTCKHKPSYIKED
ncbi:hypothetical protein KY343_02930, partial [Candidatus Woesearchaeota archaeon]|nr:hypothetical protein [Candidatus Woesearchaeota archaeon]